MAKAAKQYGLRVGHATTFRRTVNIGTEDKPKRVQLVFEPETPQELTEKEVAGLQQEIMEGIIVPWEEDGRKLRPTQSPSPDAVGLMKSLQEENADLRRRNEELASELAELDGDLDEDLEEEEATTSARSSRLADLEIHEGTRAALQDAGLTTVKKIEDHKRKHGSLVDVPGIGEARADEIDEAIAKAK